MPFGRHMPYRSTLEARLARKATRAIKTLDYTGECGLEVIGCCCPVCGDLSLKRQRIKRWLLDLEREHPGIKQSMLRALGNVALRHLLDTRLNPPGELMAQVGDPAGPALIGAAAS